MKTYKYFATRLSGDIVAIRRTLVGLKRITSQFTYRDGTSMQQIAYSGGIIVGTMAYNLWYNLTHKRIGPNGFIKIDRGDVTGIKPYLS